MTERRRGWPRNCGYVRRPVAIRTMELRSVTEQTWPYVPSLLFAVAAWPRVLDQMRRGSYIVWTDQPVGLRLPLMIRIEGESRPRGLDHWRGM